jgi:hypothetical protein
MSLPLFDNFRWRFTKNKVANNDIIFILALIWPNLQLRVILCTDRFIALPELSRSVDLI